MNKIFLLILTLHLQSKRINLKVKLKVKVNQIVGMDAKSVSPQPNAHNVKAKTLPLEMVFAHVLRNKLMRTLRSATPARVEPTGIQQYSVVKNARQVVLLVQTRRHVRLASQTM